MTWNVYFVLSKDNSKIQRIFKSSAIWKRINLFNLPLSVWRFQYQRSFYLKEKIRFPGQFQRTLSLLMFCFFLVLGAKWRWRPRNESKVPYFDSAYAEAWFLHVVHYTIEYKAQRTFIGLHAITYVREQHRARRMKLLLLGRGALVWSFSRVSERIWSNVGNTRISMYVHISRTIEIT